MLVHRLLDAFFRTLDVVDATRDRVDRLLGREPQPDPWAVDWPPPEPDLPPAGSNGVVAKPEPEAQPQPEPEPEPEPAPKAQSEATPAESTPAKAKSAKAKATPKKSSRSRKGSVDRSGKDFESARARSIKEHLEEHNRPVITDDAELDGKKVLARVVWALGAAGEAGAEKGLTTADTSALLHLAAGVEVFSTNVGRACRDHPELILEGEPDGRSKRYRLSEAGRQRAGELATRPA